MNTAWFSLSLVFDQLDVVSYEEVVRLPAFKRKTLVLIGIFSFAHFCLYFPACIMCPPQKKAVRKKISEVSWVLHIEQV